MITRTIDAPYLYTACPACEQQIRLTLSINPDGTLEYDAAMGELGLRLHLRYACEAVER